MSINRISATVYAPNIASQKVLLKNGFRQEGTIRKGVYKNNEYYDLYYFGKLKEEM
ncbi:MAG: GNAT family N-acetyltransferase [Solobacterium sp.]|nr:GNAT family N-acetyltransferase [Solobacterium sp.]